MRLVNQQRRVMRVSNFSNRRQIGSLSVIVGACYQHRLNIRVAAERLLYRLRRYLRVNTKGFVVFRHYKHRLQICQKQSAGHTAVRVARNENLIARFARRHQHRMDCARCAVNGKKAFIAAVQLRRQILRFFNIS